MFSVRTAGRTRIRMFALLTAYLIVSAPAAWAQERTVKFSALRMSVEQALEQITAQSGYYFAYNSVLFDTRRTIQFSSEELSVENALGELLEGADFTFVRKNQYIAIAPKFPFDTTAAPAVLRTGEAYVPNDPYLLSLAKPIPKSLSPVPQTPVIELADQTEVQPDVVRSEAIPAFTSRRIPVDSYFHADLPKLAIQANLLYGAAALAPNLSLDVGLGRRTSLQLTGSYNGWKREGTPDDNRKLTHRVFRGEFRYWFCERLNGHFVGGHAFHWRYNIGNYNLPFFDFKKEYRYSGTAWGAGITYGYHLMLSPRWGLEFSVGAGAARMKYDRYDCSICSESMGEYTKTYFGPTHATVSLVFVIK